MAERTSARKASGTQSISFEAHVRGTGGLTVIRLPGAASARLPSRGQVAVSGVMNGRAFRAVLEPDGKRGHWLKIDETLRQALALSEGDVVTLMVEPAEDWPEPGMPRDFQAALAEAPDISGVWKSITPMARWEWVRWVSATRNLHTRERRIDVAISKLRSGKRRPCCFDLAACTDPDLSRNGMLVDMM
jgi:hypothetical protein